MPYKLVSLQRAASDKHFHIVVPDFHWHTLAWWRAILLFGWRMETVGNFQPENSTFSSELTGRSRWIASIPLFVGTLLDTFIQVSDSWVGLGCY
jgi:hypothetical protein